MFLAFVQVWFSAKKKKKDVKDKNKSCRAVGEGRAPGGNPTRWGEHASSTAKTKFRACCFEVQMLTTLPIILRARINHVAIVLLVSVFCFNLGGLLTVAVIQVPYKNCQLFLV